KWSATRQQLEGGSNSSDINNSRNAAIILTCPNCPKTFSGPGRQQLYDRHVIVHTGARPFSCPHCMYNANQLSNLRRHIKSIHLPGKLPVQPLTQLRSLNLNSLGSSIHQGLEILNQSYNSVSSGDFTTGNANEHSSTLAFSGESSRNRNSEVQNSHSASGSSSITSASSIASHINSNVCGSSDGQRH
ncbi:hypothetical protein SK128_023677, partial [Halocaridina rubra]